MSNSLKVSNSTVGAFSFMTFIQFIIVPLKSYAVDVN